MDADCCEKAVAIAGGTTHSRTDRTGLDKTQRRCQTRASFSAFLLSGVVGWEPKTIVVILRATKKLLTRLPKASVDGESDTALGDWYANRIVIDRKPLVLLVSSESLLPILAPARDIRDLPMNLPHLVEDRLVRLGVPAHLIEPEIAAMSPVGVAQTRDRSVVGMLVGFARDLTYILGAECWDESHLAGADANLANTPCRVTSKLGDVIYPDKAAPALLMQKWGTTS